MTKVQPICGGTRKLPYAFTEQGVALRKFSGTKTITPSFRAGIRGTLKLGFNPSYMFVFLWATCPPSFFGSRREAPVFFNLKTPTLKGGVISLTGASFKDMGKKISAFSKFAAKSLNLLDKIK